MKDTYTLNRIPQCIVYFQLSVLIWRVDVKIMKRKNDYLQYAVILKYTHNVRF